VPEYHVRPLVDAAAAIAPSRTVLEDDSVNEHAPVSVRIVDPYLAWNDGVWQPSQGSAPVPFPARHVLNFTGRESPPETSRAAAPADA
jgi:hypothetical protein